RFQLTVSRFAYPPPRWLYGGIIYHVFVDRYRRAGDPPVRCDAVLNPDWRGGTPALPAAWGAPLENNEFFGGTLDGVREKLRDMAALGVNCLYLSPIFEAYSNHKYDTGDYEHVDPMFGGDEALVRLLAAARRRGIRVILDGVFNHTGADSVYFNKKGRYPSLGAYQSEESPYYPWYRFKKHPDEYESWWGIDILPRLDFSSPTLRAFLLGEGGIVDRYARLGIGGLRLDVVDELEGDVVEAIKARLAAACPDAVLYGEVWEDASHKVAYGVRRQYYTGKQLDGVMNYPLRRGLIEYLRCGRTEGMRYALTEVLPNMPRRVANATMNLLGSHDTERILTALAGKEAAGHTPGELAALRLTPEEYRRARSLLILGYLTIATLPGVPSIYYGDEAGLEGYRDPLNRRPYPWHRRDAVLLAAYRRIGAMRRAEPTLAEGGFRLIALNERLLLFCRYHRRRTVLVAINRSPFVATLRFDGRCRVLYGHGARCRSYGLSGLDGVVLAMPRGRRLRAFFEDGVLITENM
ncbi:MAG: glycoside hydrolase family 13 protein, partial [Clostridia bacterium]|nr:glycoside hydrolase family 13 protein [Clostridia bacterium]